MGKRTSSGITNGGSVNIRKKTAGANDSSEGGVKDNFRRNSANLSEPTKSLVGDFKQYGVEYKKVELLQNELSEYQIIAKVAGGDMTGGSCASLACAYAANRAGYDVTDFRGGNSTEIMARGGIYDIAEADSLKSFVTKSEGVSYSSAQKLLSKVKPGEEYILVTGHHAAVVRKQDKQLQYLELQSHMGNDWMSFGSSKRDVADTLIDRFGCFNNPEQSSVLINIKGFKNNNEVRDILGYVNTASNKQRKGMFGYAR